MDRRKARWVSAKEYDFAQSVRCRSTIFTDEKRFCFDGSDGTACFWGNRRPPKNTFHKFVRGGGSVIVWGKISWKGKTSLVIVTGNLNAEEDVCLLETFSLPFTCESYSNGFIFRQDNPPAHSASHTMYFYVIEAIKLLLMSARSPDLNVIENEWSELSRRLYSKGLQFDTIED